MQPFAGRYEVEGSPRPPRTSFNPEAIQIEMTTVIQANVGRA